MSCGCKNKLEKTVVTSSGEKRIVSGNSGYNDSPRQDDPIIQRRFWHSVRAYAEACYEWYKLGKPSRTASEMAERFATCSQCPNFIQIDEERKRGRCAVCGCYLGVNPHRFLEGNKIAMKTQKCPEGKWD